MSKIKSKRQRKKLYLPPNLNKMQYQNLIGNKASSQCLKNKRKTKTKIPKHNLNIL
jgi:hypothetical protein